MSSLRESDNIEIIGASENNLKHIDVTIPKGKLVVFAGVSGSGKSSLAFDTVAVESEREWQQSYVVCNKATIPHFTKEKLANVPFLVSEEQIEIVDFLDEKVFEIDAMILKKDELISEMERYKKSLIYEYVTGKKEVPS